MFLPNETLRRPGRIRLAAFFKVVPWSWAEFLGWSVAVVLAGLAGLAFAKRGDGGAFAKKHRKELVLTIAIGLVGGGGGVFLTWLFKAIGLP